MSSRLSHFEINELYSNEEIFQSLEVSNAGGIRVCLRNKVVRRMVVLTSVPSIRQIGENPYHDRIEGDILVYTGAGREGDQQVSGINQRIIQQLIAPFPIYGFMLLGSRRDKRYTSKRWSFIGMLEYLRHYQETQVDYRRSLRQVWLFEFRIHREPRTIVVENDSQIMNQIVASIESREYDQHEDRQVINIPKAIESDLGLTSLEAESTRARLLGCSPDHFEHLIKDLLVLSGFERVDVTRFSQDGGIDVNAYPGRHMWPLQGLLIQIQAKRWLHTVGRKEVAELRGSLEPYARGAVVTTSHFSKAAILEATATGKNPITLIDGYRLATIIRLLKFNFQH